MHKDLDMIHRLLDGDLSAEERKAVERQIEADPGLRQEHASLSTAVRMLERAQPPRIPAEFTEQVMRRLPAQRISAGARILDFFFRRRILQWNAATAFAVAAVLLIAALVFVHQHPDPGMLAEREATVTVRLNFYAPQAQLVSVAGDFNRWQADANPMARQEGGLWTIDIKVQPGSYSYMFVVDGALWVTDPDAESFQDDGFGNRNAVVRVRT